MLSATTRRSQGSSAERKELLNLFVLLTFTYLKKTCGEPGHEDAKPFRSSGGKREGGML